MSWSTSTWMSNVELKFTYHPCTPLGFSIKFKPVRSELSPNSNNPHQKARSTNKIFCALIYQLYGADLFWFELQLPFHITGGGSASPFSHLKAGVASAGSPNEFILKEMHMDYSNFFTKV
jgi:hypothetical protein